MKEQIEELIAEYKVSFLASNMLYNSVSSEELKSFHKEQMRIYTNILSDLQNLLKQQQ